MDAHARDWLDDVLDGAVCWGAELDTTYRVLALTVEPRPGRHPDEAAGRGIDDRRLQLVLHPCSEVQARLVHDGSAIEQFGVGQLVAVVDRLGGARLASPVVTADPPPLTGDLSLEGAAQPMVQDGRAHAALVTLEGEERVLTLRATYDEAELRRPDGSSIAPPTQA